VSAVMIGGSAPSGRARFCFHEDILRSGLHGTEADCRRNVLALFICAAAFWLVASPV